MSVDACVVPGPTIVMLVLLTAATIWAVCARNTRSGRTVRSVADSLGVSTVTLAACDVAGIVDAYVVVGILALVFTVYVFLLRAFQTARPTPTVREWYDATKALAARPTRPTVKHNHRRAAAIAVVIASAVCSDAAVPGWCSQPVPRRAFDVSNFEHLAAVLHERHAALDIEFAAGFVQCLVDDQLLCSFDSAERRGRWHDVVVAPWAAAHPVMGVVSNTEAAVAWIAGLRQAAVLERDEVLMRNAYRALFDAGIDATGERCILAGAQTNDYYARHPAPTLERPSSSLSNITTPANCSSAQQQQGSGNHANDTLFDACVLVTDTIAVCPNASHTPPPELCRDGVWSCDRSTDGHGRGVCLCLVMMM